jgi:hypothetical protein
MPVEGYIVAGTVVVSAFTIVLLSLRLVGLHEKNAKLSIERAALKAELADVEDMYESAMTEFVERERRSETLVVDLRRRIEYWRDELEGCGTEADRGRAARSALRNMLGATEDVATSTGAGASRLLTARDADPDSSD